MLPTPDTSHVAYERVYEPAEDSFLLLDILSSASETAFLQSRFPSTTITTTTTTTTSSPGPPLVIEIGPGSGVVIAFLTAHASTIFGTRDVLTGAVDVNAHACAATTETVRRAVSSNAATASAAAFLGAVQGDLVAPLRDRSVDVVVFNPPYVPTAELPSREGGGGDSSSGDSNGHKGGKREGGGRGGGDSFEEDSYLLALSYAGGRDGMEITDRLLLDDGLPRVLSDRGCAYVLLCAQNKPDEVKERVRRGGWKVETVGSSGKKAGWEKLQIIRIWRES
ncbi:methyltransferase domain-containing protein [Xylaria castorea]|nr:methyltransferase domain-containing protein [Xylaria castorea]